MSGLSIANGMACRLDAEEQARHQTRQPECRHQADHHAQAREFQTLSQDKMHDVTCLCAQGYAEAYLVLLLPYCIGSHTINPDRSQQKCDKSEDVQRKGGNTMR